MITRAWIYSMTTGQLLRQVECGDDLLLMQLRADEGAHIGYIDKDTQMIDPNTHHPVMKPEMADVTVSVTEIAADGVEAVNISGIPPNSIAEIISPWGKGGTQIENGDMTFTTDLSGEYTIRLVSSLFLPFEVVINAL